MRLVVRCGICSLLALATCRLALSAPPPPPKMTGSLRRSLEELDQAIQDIPGASENIQELRAWLEEARKSVEEDWDLTKANRGLSLLGEAIETELGGKPAKLLAAKLVQRVREVKVFPPVFYPKSGKRVLPDMIRAAVGERLAAQALAARGHAVLFFRLAVDKANEHGFDIVTMKNGKVYFIDNKAFTVGGKVYAASALTSTFAKHLRKMVTKFLEFAEDPERTQPERELYGEAVHAIRSDNYTRAVTNANITSDDRILTGLDPRLQGRPIEFLDLLRSIGERRTIYIREPEYIHLRHGAAQAWYAWAREHFPDDDVNFISPRGRVPPGETVQVLRGEPGSL